MEYIDFKKIQNNYNSIKNKLNELSAEYETDLGTLCACFNGYNFTENDLFDFEQDNTIYTITMIDGTPMLDHHIQIFLKNFDDWVDVFME